MSFARGKLGDVVGRDRLEKGQGRPARDRPPPHVAHVEEADGRPDSLVFLDPAAVLDRHLPASEFHELAARPTVLFEQGSAVHGPHSSRAATAIESPKLDLLMTPRYGGAPWQTPMPI